MALAGVSQHDVISDIKGFGRIPKSFLTSNTDSPVDLPGFEEYIEERNDDTIKELEKISYYGVTLNVKPSFKMNKRRWENYTADQQISILTRIEKAYRRDNDNIELVKMTFEPCPSNGVMHAHILYKMSHMDHFKMLEYYNSKFSGDDINTKIPWRMCDSVECRDIDGWLKYITKLQ